MNKTSIFYTMVCSLFFTITAFAESTNSAQMFNQNPIVTGTPMQNCPVETIQQPSTGLNTVINKIMNPVILDNNKTCTPWMSDGSIEWGYAILVFWVSGSFNPMCVGNPYFPYLGGFSENMIGAFTPAVGGGQGNMSYICCSMDLTGNVSMQATWQSQCN